MGAVRTAEVAFPAFSEEMFHLRPRVVLVWKTHQVQGQHKRSKTTLRLVVNCVIYLRRGATASFTQCRLHPSTGLSWWSLWLADRNGSLIKIQDTGLPVRQQIVPLLFWVFSSSFALFLSLSSNRNAGSDFPMRVDIGEEEEEEKEEKTAVEDFLY